LNRHSVCTQISATGYAATFACKTVTCDNQISDREGLIYGSVSMSYRPLAVAAAVAALSSMHIASAAAQSVYVAPGGVYIGAGAGPVYVTPAAPLNGSTACVAPYAQGCGTAAYVDPGYDDGYGPGGYVAAAYPDEYGPGPYRPAPYVAPGYGYGPGPYVAPRYGYGYGPGPYVAPRYGYGPGPGPYVAPRVGYGYGPAAPAPIRRHFNGPPAAYAAAVAPRPRVAIPYRAGRCVGRHCY